jgi:very-short-patch-repair endonuclease
MIDKLKTGIYKDKIRITPDNKYVSIFDLINIVVGILNPRKCWYDILNKNKQLEIFNYKFDGKGQRVTPCYKIENIIELIKIIMISVRLPYSEKETIMNYFDIPYDKLYVRTYIEEEIHENILKVFSEDFVQQYTVLGYKIDLYSIKYKIAIECDEYHESYNQKNENNRQKEITKELNCKWIRYKPYNEHFDIFILIKDIYKLIQSNK